MYSAFALDLISGNVNEALDARCLSSLEQHVRAQNVRFGKLEGVSKRVIYVPRELERVRPGDREITLHTDVSLRSKVNDGVNLLHFENVVNEVGRENVTLRPSG